MFDVIVVGLGAMGSATLFELARRGVRALGVDQFSPPHTQGSTHGRTRIIREAYFEHPLYVPLVRRAYELWDELEHESGRKLFHQTGGLMIGPADGALVAGALRSAVAHDVPHEMLAADEVRHRWPAYDPPDDHAALFELRAGLLLPEACVETHLELARGKGVTTRTGERVRAWRADGDGVAVTTDAATHRAARVVITAGPWLRSLVPDLPLPLTIERQMFHWFEPGARRDLHRASRCPLALWEFERDRMVATFPDLGDGVKAGVHHEGEATDPATVRRDTTPAEDADIRDILARLMPDAAGRQLEARVCLYTNTPDRDFLIDAHPLHPEALLVSPCSGHGFKFASAIGEAVADIIVRGKAAFDLTPFRLDRFGLRAATCEFEASQGR
ncbi:MAG: N-methyl-L-tryptophan oxidase [Gemmatimonadota bacterium]|nr:N-methyl-L-tryptophan oxidase [Gemmatimonadota bacterium]